MEKKSIIGPIISVFVMVLVISILSGLTFLFVTQLKTNAISTSTKATFTVTNESGFLNGTGYTLATINEPSFASPTAVLVINASSNTSIAAGNYSLSSAGVLSNLTGEIYSTVKITYTYSAIDSDSRNAYESINDTEAAGATVVSYLSLIFLAVIFGAILTLVLRIILPYVNLGKQMGGF